MRGERRISVRRLVVDAISVGPVGTVGSVISEEAVLMRASLVPETVHPGRTLEAERQVWEEAASGDELAAGTIGTIEAIGGRPVLRIESDGIEPTRR